jgi:type III secretion system-like peptide-binding chaperone
MSKPLHARVCAHLLAMSATALASLSCTDPEAGYRDIEAANVRWITAQLRKIQQEGGKANHVIFTADILRGYYIQFTSGKGSPDLRGEAVSNHYLPPEHALDSDQMALMKSLEWKIKEKQNYYRTWQARTDDDRKAIAQAVVRTFIEVYRLPRTLSLDTELELDEPAKVVPEKK